MAGNANESISQAAMASGADSLFRRGIDRGGPASCRGTPYLGTLFRRLQLSQRALAPLFDLVEFTLHDADVFQLAFEVGAFVGEDLEQALKLADAAVMAGGVEAEHFTDLDQRETQPFAAQG